MYWTEIVPALVLGALVITLPGLAMGAVLGLRGIALVSRAPVFSVAMIGVAAVLEPMLSVPFTPLTIGAGCAVLTVGAWGLLRLVGGRRGRPDGVPAAPLGERLLVAGAVGVAFIGIFLRVKQGIIVPDALAQLSDVIFHLNTVEYILDTENGSTLTVGASVSPGGAPSVYPAAWHDVHAIVHALSDLPIVASANATVIIVAALGWPLSLLALVWSLRSGEGPPQSSRLSFYAVGGGVAAAASAVAFPSTMLTWGVLYPTMLALALVPAVVAIVIELIRAVRRRQRREITSLSLQALIGASAVTLAQPSALVSAAALLLPFLLGSLWAAESRPSPRLRSTAVSLGISLPVVVGLWILVRPPRERWWERGVLGHGETWAPTLQEAHALGDFLTSALGSGSVIWVFAVLTWLGAWACWRRPGSRWLVIAWLFSGFLWMVADSWDFSLARAVLVGPWYNDAFRLAAMTATPAALLAGYGAATIADRAEQLLGRAGPRIPTGWVRGALAVVMLGALLLTSSSRPARDAWGPVSRDYEVHEHSLLLTEDEYTVLEQVPQHVPEDEVILANPWGGGALAYSMVDREVSSRHVSTMVDSPYAPIVEGVGDPAQRDEVCRAVTATGAYWYLDFVDSADMGGAQDEVFAPLVEAAQSGLLDPVVVEGEVGLYRIDFC